MEYDDIDTVAINAATVDNDNELTESSSGSRSDLDEKGKRDQRVISRSRFLEAIVFLICFAFNLNGEYVIVERYLYLI